MRAIPKNPGMDYVVGTQFRRHVYVLAKSSLHLFIVPAHTNSSIESDAYPVGSTGGTPKITSTTDCHLFSLLLLIWHTTMAAGSTIVLRDFPGALNQGNQNISMATTEALPPAACENQ